MKHLFILLFTACTLLTYAQVPEGYPANYAKAPRFKALIYYTQHADCLLYTSDAADEL